MKKIVSLIVFILIFSCETEEQKKQKAQEVVQALISNIQMDNYESIFEYYPSFKDWRGNYWKYESIDFNSTMIKEDGTIEIFAKSNNNQLYFLLDKNDEKYQIVKSKGLSSYLNSNIYKYSKRIGCIGINESDIEIAKICQENENDYNNLVRLIKNEIESKTILDNHSLSVVGGGPFYAYGDVVIKNHSNFKIPNNSYEIYVKFFDNNNQELYKFKYDGSYSSISFNSIESLNIMEPIPKNFRKVSIECVIIDTEFIEEIIGEYAEGSFCNYSNNL